jgi:8-oxo-dGTP pyrophosphatase MutT (NUDIX family)
MTAPTHAGGIVFRGAGDEVEFLVVQARDNPTQWVFPKGHIEAEETAAAAARREVREEAGVSAEIQGEAGSYEFELPRESVRTRYFLMRFAAEEESGERRGRRWCGYAQARELLTFADSRALLAKAEKLRRRLGAA